ncbi:hypothetical protein L218DRAFT_960409 [Marasmius fiardii PR-910]|nr:hypothetical protein L218DRAFT_960409 [Marasmius fiardii PR-910]
MSSPSTLSTANSSLFTSTPDSVGSISPFICSNSQLSSASSSEGSFPRKTVTKTPYQRGIENLVDQLRTSPETRFMGAYMLMRFLWCLSMKPQAGASGRGSVSKVDAGVGEERRSMASKGGRVEKANEKVRENEYRNGVKGEALVEALGVDKERFVETMWDVAVGCLALSVKMHRDFLPPLYPVCSQVFEDMAPLGGGMDYSQFERAQRLILFALKYNLGGSPQAVFYDLWESGILRDVLSSWAKSRPACDDEKEKEVLKWWGAVQARTWEVLFKAVVDPKVLFFPLTALLGCAVVVGVEEVLVREVYAYDVYGSGEGCWWSEFEFRSETQRGEVGKVEKRRRRRAEEECGGLVEDVKSVLGIREVGLSWF